MHSKSGVSGRHRNMIDVRLTLAGEPALIASVFVLPNERLIDLLNDDRAFIPVRKSTGETMIIAKTQIVSVVETNGEENADGDGGANGDARSRKAFDPYAALRVSRDASLEEIRAAYKQRIKAVHPDSIAGLELDEDLSRAAVQATQRVNYAYKKILAERNDIRRGSSHGEEDAA